MTAGRSTGAPSTIRRRGHALARGGIDSGWAVPIGIVLSLSAIVGVRALAVRAGLDGLLVGAAFGAALVVLWIVARTRRSAAAERFDVVRFAVGIGVGVAVGLVLVMVAAVGPAIAGTAAIPGIGRPAAPFVPWALITLVVVAAEEGVLRGVLFDRLERVAGLALAIALTTVLFALMHVPLYGWHVVPLDLAVGLVMAGLRISTRGLAAPIAAHAVADLATWWL